MNEFILLLVINAALAGAVIVIALKSIIDIPTLVIALVSGIVLLYVKKIKEIHVITAAAVVGWVMKNYLM
jgi:chromate transporter